MSSVRLIFHREDVERVLSSAVESGRLLAGQGGSSYDFLRGYAAALRLVSTGFGFPCPTTTLSQNDPVSGRQDWGRTEAGLGQVAASETEQPGVLTPHASGAGLTLLRKRGKL